MQRFDEARQTVHEAQAGKMDDSVLHSALYALAFVAADSAAMADQQQWFVVSKPEENIGLSLASDTEAYGGHLAKARELTKRAVDSAIRADSKENGAIWQAIAAQREAAYGNPTEARHSAGESFESCPHKSGRRESKPRLRLPWRAIRPESNPWRKTWGNASRWTLKSRRFGYPRFRRNWH